MEKEKTTYTNLDRRILISMIVNKEFLSRVAIKIEKPPFEAKWASIIYKWCVDYYNEFQDAPKQQIVPMFQSWKENIEDTDAVLMENLIRSLSEEAEAYEEINVPYMVKETERRFNLLRLKKLSDEIQASVASRDVEEAQVLLNDFHKVELTASEGIDVLRDKESLLEAFEKKQESLLNFKGPLGEFFEDQLVREGFVAFQGPDKVGKSWWLGEVAWTGMLQGKTVAMFEVGDMTKSQILRRFASRITGKPYLKRYCGRFKVPISIDWDDDTKSLVPSYEHVLVENPVGFEEGKKAFSRILEKLKAGKRVPLKLSMHANSSINVREIDSILSTWERQDNFLPDIVVIDYADILAPESNRRDFRHQINETWMALRRLSQERNCLVVTATQSDSEAYRTRVQTRSNFSEDKRKLSHVTGLVGLNQDEAEEEAGLLRLNWIVLREGEYVTTWCLTVGRCLRIGKVHTCAAWGSYEKN